ncbi:TPA: hypothetical protein ACTZ5A_005577 [Bacillus cereus]
MKYHLVGLNSEKRKIKLGVEIKRLKDVDLSKYAKPGNNGYLGEVGVLVDNIEIPKVENMQPSVIEKGTRIAQGIISPSGTNYFC